MVDELFSKSLPITIKCQDREDRKGCIHVAVEMHTTMTPIHRKELVVRLTDEQDLFFLYTLTLTEDDFQSLKLQQGLLVDFAAFPQQFISLLSLCLQEEHKEVPKFLLVLVSGGASSGSTANLNVIETNPFKHLTHLSLKFLPAVDTDVKKYLVGCLKQLKEENVSLLSRLEATQQALGRDVREARDALATRTTELRDVRADWGRQAAEHATQHAHTLSSHTQSTMQAQTEVQRKHDDAVERLTHSHHKVVSDLEARVRDLDKANKESCQRRDTSAAGERQLRARLAAADADVARGRADAEGARDRALERDREHALLQATLSTLKGRLAVAEGDAKEAARAGGETASHLAAERDAKRRFEEELERKRRHVTKLESSVKTMSEELMKGNEIIKKLQADIRNYHMKLKLRSQVTTEQEKLVGEKSREAHETRQKLTATEGELRQSQDENRKLNESLATTMTKLEESRQLLKTNENVINWLNKQVTEVQLSGRPAPPSRAADSDCTPASATVSFRPQLQLYAGSQSYASKTVSTIRSSPALADPARAAPYQDIRQPQTLPRSQLPLPLANSTPAAPLVISPAAGLALPQSTGDRVLDVKYLQPSAGSGPVAPPTSAHHETRTALASAYFPAGK